MVKYPLKFKAAVLEKNGAPLSLLELSFDGPLKPGQVLVKFAYSGICGKQIEEIDGLGGEDKFLPHLLGHEGSGVVQDVGSGVTKVKIGDTVVAHWRKGSGMQSATPDYHIAGRKINAGWVTTFNEYAVVSENRVTAVANGVDMCHAALFGCVVTTGVGVALNAANIAPEDTVAVFGCGGVGLCAVQGANLRTPGILIAVDVNDEALKLAKTFGATDLINSTIVDPISEIRELTKGAGVSKTLVCTGNIKAIEQAVASTSVPGECLLVGVPPKGSLMTVDPFDVMHERTIKGSLGGGTYPDRDIPSYLRLLDKGKINLSGLITDIKPFSQINEAIAQMKGPTPGRLMVKF
jgi:S-(hydroxymethyl)glutathione dehydrogenase / alcohol dehydrogenase